MKLAESEIVEFVPTYEQWISDYLFGRAVVFYGRQGPREQCTTLTCATLTKEQRKLLRRRISAFFAMKKTRSQR